MINKLNARGWGWMLSISLAMIAAAGLTLYKFGLGIQTGIFAAVSVIAAAGSYINYRKEIK